MDEPSRGGSDGQGPSLTTSWFTSPAQVAQANVSVVQNALALPSAAIATLTRPTPTA
jgi:hypothetical protein